MGLGGFLLLEDMTKMHFTCIKGINATITQLTHNVVIQRGMAMVIGRLLTVGLFLCWYCDVAKTSSLVIS